MKEKVFLDKIFPKTAPSRAGKSDFFQKSRPELGKNSVFSRLEASSGKNLVVAVTCRLDFDLRILYFDVGFAIKSANLRINEATMELCGAGAFHRVQRKIFTLQIQAADITKSSQRKGNLRNQAR